MALTDVPEDDLTISVPDGRYFRFEACMAYRKVSGHSVKEMDFGWMNEDGQHLWLLELKNYDRQIPAHLDQTLHEFRSNVSDLQSNLPQKIIHSVLLISSSWSNIPFGRDLRSGIEATFPDFPQSAVPVRAIVAINLDNPGDRALIGPLQDAIQQAVDVLKLDKVQVLPVGHPRTRELLGIEIQAVT